MPGVDVPEALVEGYFAAADAADLTVLGARDRAGAVRAHLALAAARAPGTAAVRVGNPTVERDGWETPHTVIEVVSDDMPFVVDSLTALVARAGYDVHLLVHPVVEGASFVHVEIDRESDPAILGALAASVESVLADVRAAVDDWVPMRARVLARAQDLRAAPPTGVPAGDADEAAAFLERLADNHFTFVGAADDTGGNALGVARRRLPEGLPDLDRAPTPVLTLTKTLERSTVHRAVPFDLVGVKQFDSRGRVIGEERFFGLHTADTYSEPITELPVLRRKADAVMARAGFAAAGHDSRTLANVLATLPRDEMLRGSADGLYELAMGVARLGERRRLRLFVSHDPSHRFVSCLVYVPRDRYTTSVRSAVLDALRDAYRGGDVDFTALVTESVLARLHVVVQRPQRVDVDEVAVESELARIARAWTDDFRDALVSARGEEAGLDAFRAWGDAFPSAYQSDVTAVEAVRDLSVLEAGDDLAIRLVGARPDAIAHLALYRVGAPLVLSDVMRVLEHLDVTVVDEHPYEITPSGLPPRWIYSFGVRATHRAVLADPGAQSRVAELFLGVWAGTIENDSLNRLVLRAGLTARDVVVLRALVKYLHQCGVRFTEGSVADALAANPRTTALVVELFATRFDPVLGDEDRSSRGAALEAQLAHEIDRVASLDEDRILRTLVALVQAAVRTNAFVSTATEYLAIKLDPTKLPFLPAPRPRHEIWVYSPTIEAVHVRGGDVARGGIRWSERRDDFRTEILGLMKAQTEKNAVIVPVGAKGGFVVKRPPADSEALRREVLACYRSFIAALLDVTDNLVDGSVVAPRGIVRHDGDDPYLVVAADKGTASFSDEANRLAVDRSYWLGDAFASGGSSGYDHKAMGITSRGAWVSVRAHFRAMGVDADAAELTTVGIGDMSGDVFGNGMLRSRHLKLLAAFDHRHVFLDPDPDPAVSYEERRRLFALPASSWADYDAALVSAGGGVYARENKALPVSPEVRAALGIEGDVGTLTPDEMVSAILRAPVDLLWNGGIGTFVKASDETDADVGDRATDAVRVDADELRCRVVAEGGNLGLTQRARVEYALAGGRVNTDAIDNSAGVDCSDHEVNIKILLGRAIGARVLAAVDRDPLLASMTDEVAALVLADNEAQTNALEIASVEAPDFVGVHARQIERLEHAGILDRELERLPDAKALQERHVNDRGLTSPELAVLLAFTKLELQRALVESDVPDDSFFRRDLVDYFPTPLRERYADAIDAHPLRREITATVIANAVVNRAGISFLSRLSDEIGVGLPALARAHVIARDLFDVVEVWSAIDGLDLVVPSATQDRMFLAARRLVERAARWLAREGREHDAGGAIARFRGPVHAILGRLPELVVGTGAEQLSATAAQLRAGGVPPDLASRVAGFEAAVAALPIADVASGLGTPVLDVAAVHFLLAARLRLDWLRDRIAELPRADRWQTEARAALRDDLTDIHQELTRAVVATTDRADPVATRVEQWVAAHDEAVARALGVLADVEAGGVFDLATLGAARRELRELVT